MTQGFENSRFASLTCVAATVGQHLRNQGHALGAHGVVVLSLQLLANLAPSGQA